MPRVVVFDSTGGPDVLHVVDEPAAEPGPGEVRVKIEAAGVNRLESLMRSGASPLPVRLPHARIGIEGTGTVDAIGPDVSSVSVGDPVLITAVLAVEDSGTYAEYTVVPASAVVPRPAGLDAVGAAALWVTYSTAYGALIEKGGMRAGDRVLITAASSGVGMAAIQIANQVGAIPIAVTRRSAKRDALLAAGAAEVIATDSDDLVKSALAFTGGTGVDIAIDSVMGPGLADLAAATKAGGTIVTVGWLDPRPAPLPMKAPLTIIRYLGYELLLNPEAVKRIAAFLAAGVRTGALRPVVDKVFPLDEAAEAHRYLEQGDQVGKIVLTV